jgi:hypothetical protein
MELSSFSEHIVVERFERNGEAVELTINIDTIVPDYYDKLEERLEPVTKRYQALQARIETLKTQLKKQAKAKRKRSAVGLPSIRSFEKEIAEIQRETAAEKLTCPVQLPDGSMTCLLKGWDITENGLAIAPTKENLMRLPPSLVVALWERVIARAETVKKTVDEGTIQRPTISETTETGSQEFTIPLSAPAM